MKRARREYSIEDGETGETYFRKEVMSQLDSVQHELQRAADLAEKAAQPREITVVDAQERTIRTIDLSSIKGHMVRFHPESYQITLELTLATGEKLAYTGCEEVVEIALEVHRKYHMFRNIVPKRVYDRRHYPFVPHKPRYALFGQQHPKFMFEQHPLGNQSMRLTVFPTCPSPKVWREFLAPLHDSEE